MSPFCHSGLFLKGENSGKEQKTPLKPRREEEQKSSINSDDPLGVCSP